MENTNLFYFLFIFVAIHCGSLTVAQGTVSLSNSDFIGSQGTVVCSFGYVISSTTLATCQQSGSTGIWVNVPTCNGNFLFFVCLCSRVYLLTLLIIYYYDSYFFSP